MANNMINLDTCKFIIYGFRNRYNTFGHIHEAWYRALKFKFPNREDYWVDEQSDRGDADFSNALVLSINVADFSGLPKRTDCFYAIHNLDERVKKHFGDLKQYSMMNYGLYTSTTKLGQDDIEIGFETYLSLQQHEDYTTMVLRWGTDLFPHEIEANKPTQVFNSDS